MLKYIIFLVLFMLSCIASNTATGGGYDITYIDGHYYIITDQGGITHKANCTGDHN